MDIIFAIKFVHELGAAVMLGAWLAIMAFMLLANGTANTSVVALTSQFVVKVEMFIMIAALAVPPISGFPLSAAVGVSPADNFWIDISLAVYAVVVLLWLVAVYLEFRIRNVTRAAALAAKPLPNTYRRLFLAWCVAAFPVLLGMVGLFLLMIWQPHLD